MKQQFTSFLAICLLAVIALVGCSNSSDGPSFSDDDLLKRGRAGHDAATQGSKTPPTTATTAGN